MQEEGFIIRPTKFGVSRDAGALSSNKTEANSGEWYRELISSRVAVGNGTVKLICSVPPSTIEITDEIREIYVYAESLEGDDFLLAFGQPTDTIQYDPEGTVTFELQLTLLSDIDLTANYVFKNTKQTELDEHLNAPDAHPEYAEAMQKAGILVPDGMYPYQRLGQSFDEFVEFDGTKAFASSDGVMIQAVRNGDELNNEKIIFDGRTLDLVLSDFNVNNPKKQVSHNGNGNEILSGTLTLQGGSYNVDEKDVVYKHPDGYYAKALADGTDKSKVLGMAFRQENLVRGIGGFVSYDTGYPINTSLFLSDIDAGKLTNISTSTSIGHVAGSDYILFGSTGGNGSSGANAGYDAIVSNDRGFKRFFTLQEAINEVPPHGFILVEKLEELKTRIRTFGKTVNIFFRGANTGLTKFTGQNEIQIIKFSDVPTSGTWRLEFLDTVTHKLQFSNDMAFNATANVIEAEINNLKGHNGCAVQGDYQDGFTLVFNDYIDLPLVQFTDQGRNEIQRFDLSAVPTDGTCDFEFQGESGVNHAFNDSSDQLFAILLSLGGISDIKIEGGIEQRFYEIEFQGVDGLENHPPIRMVNSNLNVGGSGGSGGTEIQINGQLSSEGPIDARTIINGRYPSSNLKVGTANIEITATEVQKGIEVGPSKAIELDSDACQIRGVGLIENFSTGIDMSSFVKSRIEMHFKKTDLPIDGKEQIIGRDFNFDGSLGIERDVFDTKPIWDNPTGIKDGVNATYQLTLGKPNSISQFMLMRDELVLSPDWYSIENDIITITKSGANPSASQSLRAWYTPDTKEFTPDIQYYSPWKESVEGLDDNFRISFTNPYNMGSDRLEFYRNGVLSFLGTNLGNKADRFQESGDREVSLSLHTRLKDVFTGLFKGIRVLSKGEIIEKSNQTLLTVPKYTPNNNSLIIYRNGVLMNSIESGQAVSQYIEIDSNTIQLAHPSNVRDVFTFIVYEFDGTREDIAGINNSKDVTLNHNISLGNTMVYRNGILLQESNVGPEVSRYSVSNSLQINLGLEAQPDNVITVINYN